MRIDAEIRVITNTLEEAEAVAAHLKRIHGAAITLRRPYEGSKGGYLINGILIVEEPQPAPAQQSA